MGLARANAIALVGVQGHVVEIEADIENGLVTLLLVGLPDTALREARDRIRSAIVNSGESWPSRRITVGLSPASLPKRGSGFDIGIACAILAASQALPPASLDGIVLIGELGLDGRIRPVPGVLPAAAAAAAAGFASVVVATENAAEAALVPELRVVAAPTLSALTSWLRAGRPSAGSGADAAPRADGRGAAWTDERSVRGGKAAPSKRPGASGTNTAPRADGRGAAWTDERSVRGGKAAPSKRPEASGTNAVSVFEPGRDAREMFADYDAEPANGGGSGSNKDLADLVGQPIARRAAEICAAGGHHLMLLGPPGVGKTMLAERIPTVMPRLEPWAALEVSAIHSVAGMLPPGRPLIVNPPFCAPHHTASRAAIVGGGSGVIRPGAASLSHNGLLFLDEAPEFSRDVLDGLRQPLESGEVVIARAAVTARFPARFTLVLAANPCPCASASTTRAACDCTPMAKRRYLSRLSGPLLDRVDAKIEFLPVSRRELLSDRAFTETSAVVAERVRLARSRAGTRLAETPWRLNAQIPGSELRRRFAPAASALAPLERAMDLGRISARGADRVIRLSWTLADLAGTGRPGVAEVGYALSLWLGTSQ